MERISFLINVSVNTLDHVKLLLKSLKENLKGQEHEILVFVDSDNEGSLEYLRTQKDNFFDLKIITHKLKPCVGYSRNSNILVELAQHKIVSYLQSDMVIGPNYDEYILEELEENCILSATRIEPPLHGSSDKTITYDLGTDPTKFDWDKFQEFSNVVRQDVTMEYFFAPFTFYKNVWTDIGGYDTMFRKSREDSDILQRFIQKGIKIKQTFKANVYHFTCVSSRGKNWFDQSNHEAQRKVELQTQADQIELRKFIRKWGTFNHGESKLDRLDMDLVWVNGDVRELIYFFEYYFPRVWVPTKDMKDTIVNAYKAEQDIANQTLKFSEEDWEVSKKFYKRVDYDAIIQVGEPKDYNIRVELDLTRDTKGLPLKNVESFAQVLPHLSSVLINEDKGVYEVGCAKIHLKKKVNLAVRDNIVVGNPQFDMSLLTIE